MSPAFMAVRDALDLGRQKLEQAGIAGAARDARWLMAAAMGIPRDRLGLHLDDPINNEIEFFFFHNIMSRCHGEPVSKILGEREFYGRVFRVSKDVLDPRPETETLVEVALAELFETVLDLGTGSGCILVTLLAERPAATGIGTDISEAALAVARENATRLGVTDRAILVQSDWFQAVRGTFDLIVSNPPYIAAEEMGALQAEVRDHDPRSALTDEADGLSAYRAIAAGAPDHLKPGGRLIVEIGPTQGRAVSQMFRQAGLKDVQVFPDLDGRDRVVIGRAGQA